MNYPFYERLIAPARRSNEIWRICVGCVMIAVAYPLCLHLYWDLLSGIAGLPRWAVQTAVETGLRPVWTLALLFSFVGFWIACFFVVRFLHKRPFRSLFGSFRGVAYDFWRVVIAIVLLNVALAVLPPYGDGESSDALRNPALSLSTWIALLPFSLIAILIQTGAEEVLFRGYLQSQLAARFKSPLIWILVPSFLFAAGHYAPNIHGENNTFIVIWAGLFGVLAADLTARSGTLGAALGFHFANNVFALLLVGSPGAMGGLALYHDRVAVSGEPFPTTTMIIQCGFLLIAWLAARIALRR
ncbi:CPBP family intramembrane glutamic endopeptidase [Cochlodiniinecator piscidefendens]|uniref:CPBP family intramembrane glutamic endopeptidase n=1 Tax=Cochlodiniinecator piscidefendens TaxID=2715756 RepID=UPI00140BF07C|nr:CPBP family intramembrane glutamic endopeptidase [Cochlodiniinecator piscidefendens]